VTDQPDRYANARAVEQAIKDAARAVHQTDPTRQIDDLIRQAYYDRFLSRVFSDGEASQWVLKGGTGMLARVPQARRTQDIDLFRDGYGKDQSLADLRRLVQVDLGDFFRFTYISHADIITGQAQPYSGGYKVRFDVFLGVKKVAVLKVDLSAHETAVGSVRFFVPVNRLGLSRLVSHAYRLYPLPEQIADKVCASLAVYDGFPSSREKDLVDLVIIALTQTVDANRVISAVRQEARLRRLDLPDVFTVPATWGMSYAESARNTLAAGYTIRDAQALMTAFIDPLLAAAVAETTWNPNTQAWGTPAAVDPGPA
jgi:hypothetical protein